MRRSGGAGGGLWFSPRDPHPLLLLPGAGETHKWVPETPGFPLPAHGEQPLPELLVVN